MKCLERIIKQADNIAYDPSEELKFNNSRRKNAWKLNEAATIGDEDSYESAIKKSDNMTKISIMFHQALQAKKS